MRAFVTGAAGFIGSHLVDRLLSQAYEVTGYDNLSTGRRSFLQTAFGYDSFTFIEGDVLDEPKLREAMAGAGVCFHLAANADVRSGTAHPKRDLEQNTVATAVVLEAMRAAGVGQIAFASTGSIYGEPEIFPTPEDAPFPVQTSLYGASKLAGEALIQAYCAGFGFQAHLFRFVSILGERYTHGHIFDFCRQIREHPERLHVLGNGKQRKSYLYVHDCIDAMLTAVQRASDRVNIFNLGTDDHCEVNDSIAWICEHLRVSPEIIYQGGERGWVGDSPFIYLRCDRMRALGWKPKLSIREGVIRTLDYLQRHPELLENRYGS